MRNIFKTLQISTIQLNSISNVSIFFWNLITVIILTPLVYRSIGKVEYGLWVFIMTLLSYSSLLYLGFGSAIIRFIADYLAQNLITKINEMVSTLMAIYIGLGILTVLFSVVVSIILPFIMPIDSESIFAARLAIVILGITLGMGFPMSGFEGIIIGMQKYTVDNSINLLTSVLYFSFALILLPIYPSIITLAILTFFTTIINMGIKRGYILKKFNFIEIRFKNFNKSIVAPLFKFSIKSFFIQMSSQIIGQVGILIIGTTVGPSYVAQYSIPQRMVSYIHDLQYAMCNVFFPKFAQLFSEKQFEKINNYWLQISNISLTIGLCLVGMIFFYGDLIQCLWMGDTFSVNYLLTVTLGVFALIQQPINVILLTATDKHALPAAVFFIEALVNLVLSLIFVRLWGLQGIALAALIPAVVVRLFFIPLLVLKTFKISIKSFIVKSSIVPFLSLLVPFGFLIMCRNHNLGTTLKEFLIVGVCYTMISVISVILINKEIRSYFRQFSFGPLKWLFGTN